MKLLSLDDDVFATRPDLSDGSDLPAHTRIEYWLEHLIVSRRLEAGDKLPSEVDMAAALGISRMTLRQALASVEAKGMLERRRGRFGGNFVSEPRFDFNLSGLPGFTEQMRRAHVQAGASVVQASTRRPGPEVRGALDLKRGEQAHEIIRVRSANGEPVTLEQTYFPAKLFPGLLECDLTGSLYRVMQDRFGKGPYTADEVISPVVASARQAELLGVKEESPLLLITRTSFSSDGSAVEFSRDFFRPDRTRISLRTRVGEEVTGVAAEVSTHQ